MINIFNNAVYAAGVSIADTPLGPGKGTLGNTYPQISTLVTIILKNSLTIAGIILLALLIFGGLSYIIGAGGDPKKAEQAQGVITSSLIGFAVVLTAYFIIQIIEVITGVNII